ncbi:MAG: GNAT family N-acetyltransferase [Anaerolineae bacterium]
MPEKQNPILRDFPDSFETERLIIRAPRPGDGPALYEAVIGSLDHLRPWMPWAQHPPTLESSEQQVRLGAARWAAREDLWLMLIRKADGRWIGGSGLHRMDWAVPRFEIGYWVRAEAQGKGYITEAVNGITAFAFDVLGAERVEIRCDAHNKRSAAVAERCGYRLEGRLRHEARAVSGELRDTLVYSLIRPEWLARQEAADEHAS